MKIATFNIENLFHRDEYLARRSTRDSAEDWMEELERLIRKKTRITQII